jgi:cob(I)alamin adenosyltransferase
VVALSRSESVRPEILRYLNRLSTLLFAMARLVNAREGSVEEVWPGRKG